MTASCVRTHGKKDLEVSEYPFEVLYPKDVLIRIKKALLTPLDLHIINGEVVPKTSSPYILSSVALGVIVDKGVDVQNSIMGKYVAIGPECENKLFAYDVKGLARTYAAVGINCVKTLFNKHLESGLLIVPLLNKIINVLKTIEKKATITFDSCLFNIISQALSILNMQYSAIGEHTLEVVYGSKEANIRINISFDYKEDVITDSVWNVSCLRNTSFNYNVAKYLDKIRLHEILTEISVDDIDNLGLESLVEEMRRKLVVIAF